MESSYQIKLTEEQREVLVQHADILETMLAGVINEHHEQLGYMLQAYYPREKVSKVIFVPGSISIQGKYVITLRLEYIKEEYSACSAIDTVLKDHMTVTVNADPEAGLFNLKGENWPEL
jgi:hypothetical protein